MMDEIVQMFSYSFMIRAFITGIFISLCASLIGVNLVLKHYSMMGDGLSHVAFGVLALSVALKKSPITFSLPVVILCAFFLLSISNKTKLRSDSAIALLSTGSLAVGVMILSVTTGMNTDVCNYLFGSILGMRVSDMYITIVVCSVIMVIYACLYRKFFAVTFDENYATALGLNVKLLNMFLAMICAVIIVLGMKMMGALLISNLIVLPAISAMTVLKSYKSVVIYSLILSVVTFSSGLFTSYLFSTPTGASIVLINVFIFALHFIVGKLGLIK